MPLDIQKAHERYVIKQKPIQQRLFDAAEIGFIAGFKKVLETQKSESELNLNEPNDDGETLLSLAAGRGHIAIVRMLPDDKNVKFILNPQDVSNPLHVAAANGQDAVVDVLFNAEKDGKIFINPNKENRHHVMPMTLAIYERHLKTVLALAKRSISIRGIGRDAQHFIMR